MNLENSSVTSDLSLRVKLGLRAVKRSAMRKYLSGTCPFTSFQSFPRVGARGLVRCWPTAWKCRSIETQAINE